MTIFRSVLSKQAGFYLLFHLIVAVAYLVIVSIISYFHFILKHDFSIIEDWIFNHYWKIISLSKILGITTIISLLKIQSNERTPVKSFFKETTVRVEKEIYGLIVFFFILIAIFSDFTYIADNRSSISRFFSSFTGTYVFYMSDIVVLTFINKIYPYTSQGKWIEFFSLFIFSLIYYLSNKGLFLFAKNIDVTVIYHCLILSVLSRWKQLNWSRPSTFCLLFICPFSSLIGLDPLWGQDYVPFTFSTPNAPLLYPTVILLAISYLYLPLSRGH